MVGEVGSGGPFEGGGIILVPAILLARLQLVEAVKERKEKHLAMTLKC